LADLVLGGLVEPLVGGPFSLSWQGVAALGTLAALATVGVAARWPAALRWALYAGWLFTLPALGLFSWNHGYYVYAHLPIGPSVAAVGVVLSYAAALLLLVRHYRRRRPAV